MNELKGFEPVAWRCTHGGETHHFAYSTPNPSDWDTCVQLYTADQLAQVVQQRDELLAAVRRLLLCDIAEIRTIEGSPGAIRNAYAASAKVHP